MLLEELDLSSSGSGAAEETLFLREPVQEERARFREISGRETEVVHELQPGPVGVTVAATQVEGRGNLVLERVHLMAGVVVAGEKTPRLADVVDADSDREEDFTYSECDDEEQEEPAEGQKRRANRSSSSSRKNCRIVNNDEKDRVGGQERRLQERASGSDDLVDEEALVSAGALSATSAVSVSASVGEDGQHFEVVQDADGEVFDIVSVSRSVHELLSATTAAASVSVSSSLDGASPSSPLRGESIAIPTALIASDETPVTYCGLGGGGDDGVAQSAGPKTSAKTEPSTTRKIPTTLGGLSSPLPYADGEKSVGIEVGGRWVGVGNATRKKTGRIRFDDGNNVVEEGERGGTESGVGCLIPGKEESSEIGDESASAVGDDVASAATSGDMRLKDPTETRVVTEAGTENNRRCCDARRVVAATSDPVTKIRCDDDVVAPRQLSVAAGATSRSHDWRRWVMRLGERSEEKEKEDRGSEGCVEADNVTDWTLQELEEELRWIRGTLESRVRVRRGTRGGRCNVQSFASCFSRSVVFLLFCARRCRHVTHLCMEDLFLFRTSGTGSCDSIFIWRLYCRAGLLAIWLERFQRPRRSRKMYEQ